MKAISFRLLALMATVLFVTSSGQAGVVLSWSNPTPNPLTAGSSATIDLMISDTGLFPRLLDAFQLSVSISSSSGPNSGIAGGLKFDTIQPLSQPSNYVFNGVSLSANSPVPAPVGFYLADNQYGAFDATDGGGPFPGNPAPVALTAAPQVLVRIHLLSAAFAAGNYDISVDSAELYSEQGPPFDGRISTNLPSATFHIQGSPAAVPEPASGLLFALGAVGLGWKARRKSRMAV